ncbi:MAG: sulfite exporter TauE/SafE family protein [Microscillaceae bacterium]|jgi:hypothetical protein|nr:sulfite exporter TauE/SafE family protein [Microscillaceae bacterium]
MLYSAFLLGLLGSFHCVGMCAPIALALPVAHKTRWNLLKSRILYNLGRVITYAMLGAVIGLLGRGLALTGSQQWLSIGIGGLILVLMFTPSSITHRLNVLQPVARFTQLIKKQFTHLFRQKTDFSYLLIGFFNGFLPCGLVYLAMAGALATGSWSEGVLYMTLFGFGTFPMMFGVALAGNFITPTFRTLVYKRFLPIFTFALAILLIIRGLNLGIPYLSPKIYVQNQQIEAECCEKK